MSRVLHGSATVRSTMSVAKRKNTETRSCGSGGGEIRHSHSSGHTPTETHTPQPREGSAQPQAEHSTSDVERPGVEAARLLNQQIPPHLSSTLIPVDGRPYRTSLCVPLPVRQRDAQSLAAAVFCEQYTSSCCESNSAVVSAYQALVQRRKSTLVLWRG